MQGFNVNTRAERFAAWIAYALLGGYGSPSLAFEGLAPTLRWVWTGRDEDARKDPENALRYIEDPAVREAMKPFEEALDLLDEHDDARAARRDLKPPKV
jgi:hypothetical protein